MKRNLVLLIGVVLFAGLPLAAQEQTPKVEVALNYSYVRFSPSVPNSSNRSLNGGGGDFMYVFNRWWGLKAELTGYGSQTAKVPFQGGTLTNSANLFTYLFGPEITYRTNHVNVFGEVLVGGAHASTFLNLQREAGLTGAAPSENAFSLATGGGVDIYFSKHVAVRAAQVDYLMTRFTNPLTGQNSQNNFRYQGGIVFAF
jgi:opacity protein-like surface antigen